MIERVNKSVQSLEEEIAMLEGRVAPREDEATEDHNEPIVVEVPVVVTNEQETPDDAEAEPQTKEEATWKKRHADLRRHSQKVENELKARLAELEKKLESAPAALPTTPDQVKEWVEKFPQVAAIVTAIADEQATKQTEQIRSKLSAIETDREALQREKDEAKVRAKHPDFDAIVAQDQFHDWAETQPKRVQDFVYEGSPDEVIWALSLYKKEKGIATKSNERDAARATAPRRTQAELDTSTKGRFSESQVNAMSASEYERYEGEINAAIRSGNFDYDLTGAAR